MCFKIKLPTVSPSVRSHFIAGVVGLVLGAGIFAVIFGGTVRDLRKRADTVDRNIASLGDKLRSSAEQYSRFTAKLEGISGGVSGLTRGIQDLAGPIDRMEKGLGRVETRIGRVEVGTTNLDRRVGAVEGGLSGLDEKITGLGSAIEGIDSGISGISNSLSGSPDLIREGEEILGRIQSRGSGESH